MTTVKAQTAALGEETDRGLFEGLKESASDVLDLFSGVTQQDVAEGRVDISDLPREDRIELLIDGQTSSAFGSSPWSIGSGLSQDVADQIHREKGGTLVFAVEAGFIDAAQAALRSVRYALVWDDSEIAAGPESFSIKPIGKTFLIVGVKDKPQGRSLTLWITDDDLKVSVVKQAPLEDLNRVRDEVIGDISADAGKDQNPVTALINKVGGFLTASQVGGLVAIAVVGVVLVVLIRSEAFKDVAKTAANVTKGK